LVAHKRTEPGREVGAELVVSEEDPLQDKGALSGGGTEEISVVLVSGHVVSDSRRLEEAEAISTFEDGDLSTRELLKKLGGLGRFKVEISGDLNLESVIAGSNESLVDSGVVGVAVDFL